MHRAPALCGLHKRQGLRGSTADVAAECHWVGVGRMRTEESNSPEAAREGGKAKGWRSKEDAGEMIGGGGWWCSKWWCWDCTEMGRELGLATRVGSQPAELLWWGHGGVKAADAGSVQAWGEPRAEWALAANDWHTAHPGSE
eukprot:763182-Pelagomonas_calceolata.AAC.3